MNDTGSDNLTLFTTDPIFVGGGIIGYRGRLGVVNLMDANGIITPFQRLQVQVKLVRDDNTPWGQWITESAIVRVPSPNLPRLSGIGIRQALYIGTAPGNHLLAVSTTRGGLSSLL